MPKGEQYRLAKSLVFLLCIAKIIDMATGLNNQIIGMSSSYRILLLFLLVAVVSNIGFNLIFIPKYGIEGSAFATIISISIYNLLKFLFLKVKYDLNPFTIKTLLIIVVGITIILVVQLIPRTSMPLLNLVLFSGGSAILYAGVMYRMKVSPEINDFVNKQLKRVGLMK
jgi:O-antigen/teichoic acid export membrane protein